MWFSYITLTSQSSLRNYHQTIVMDIPANELLPESDMIYSLRFGKVDLDHQDIPKNATILVRVDVFTEDGIDDWFAGLVVFSYRILLTFRSLNGPRLSSLNLLIT